MRILQVNKFFDLQGGAEVYLHGLMKAEREAGHEVHAFSTTSEKNIPSDDAKYFVTRDNLERPEGLGRDLKKAAQVLWNGEAKGSFEEMLDEVKPDVVHVHNLYQHLSTSVLAPIRKRKIPCVQTLHDYKLACPSGNMFTQGSACERCKTGNYLNAIKYKCLATTFLPNALAAFEMGMTKAAQSYERTVKIFLCPSRFIKEKMEDWGEPPGKMRHVPHPTDLPQEPAVRGGGYLLYTGRLSQEKGLASFIEAAASIPELPVKIAGRGPEDERLRSLVRAKGANHIEFLGFQPPAELQKIRHRAEAVVLPTLSYENASSSLLEAMASGLPCLATRLGGNPELVEDGMNGLLVVPNDTQDWLRILRRFQALPADARHDMGVRARQKIMKNHLWDTHVERVIGCYEEAGAITR